MHIILCGDSREFSKHEAFFHWWLLFYKPWVRLFDKATLKQLHMEHFKPHGSFFYSNTSALQHSYCPITLGSNPVSQLAWTECTCWKQTCRNWGMWDASANRACYLQSSEISHSNLWNFINMNTTNCYLSGIVWCLMLWSDAESLRYRGLRLHLDHHLACAYIS